jgi:hypothetical protein
MTGAPSIGGAGLGMGMGFRNRIINGAMVIDQRNAGAAVTLSSDLYVVDRFSCRAMTSLTSTAQQSSTAPTGFSKSLLYTVGTGATAAAGDRNTITQAIEGFNTADLGWGAAGAATVTLSFWVRSSVTGTFGGALANGTLARSYPFTYTISVANTFEYKTITVAGDTSGTWATTNSAGIYVWFDMGCGATYLGTAGAWAGADYRGATGDTKLVATTGATFYITGVQLEKGATATSFDYRDYGRELIMCQRYYYQFSSTGLSDYAYAYTPYSPATYLTLPNTSASMPMYFPVTMRAAPTVTGTPNVGSLNRSTSTTGLVVFQYSSTSSGSAYAVTAYTATAEL